MEKENKIKLLLDMQEHPENFSEQELKQMESDPEMASLMEAAALGKMALQRNQTEIGEDEVDKEWKRFAEAHFANDGDADDKQKEDPEQPQAGMIVGLLRRYKIAAMFIGFIFVSGIVLAAIRIGIAVNQERQKQPETENTMVKRRTEAEKQEKTLPAADTTQTEPVVFDNVTIGRVMSEIAQHYNKEVVFRNDKVKTLRIYLKWNPQEPIEKVVETLNMFEQLSMELNDNTITVD